jgi:hypothetical protein
MPLIKEGGMAIISIGFYPPLGDNTNKAGLSPALLKANRNNMVGKVISTPSPSSSELGEEVNFSLVLE